MENLFYKMKKQITSLYQDYQYENIIFKQTEIPQPIWEKKFGWIILFASILFFFIPSNFQTLYFIFYALPLCFVLYKKSQRDLINIKTYYTKRSLSNLNNSKLMQRRFVFTSFTLFKTMKPIAAYCVICVSSFALVSGGIHTTHQYFWSEKKTPTVLIGEKITEYTGYPPESWSLKNTNNNDLISLKEQLEKQETIINE